MTYRELVPTRSQWSSGDERGQTRWRGQPSFRKNEESSEVLDLTKELKRLHRRHLEQNEDDIDGFRRELRRDAEVILGKHDYIHLLREDLRRDGEVIRRKDNSIYGLQVELRHDEELIRGKDDCIHLLREDLRHEREALQRKDNSIDSLREELRFESDLIRQKEEEVHLCHKDIVGLSRQLKEEQLELQKSKNTMTALQHDLEVAQQTIQSLTAKHVIERTELQLTSVAEGSPEEKLKMLQALFTDVYHNRILTSVIDPLDNQNLAPVIIALETSMGRSAVATETFEASIELLNGLFEKCFRGIFQHPASFDHRTATPSDLLRFFNHLRSEQHDNFRKMHIDVRLGIERFCNLANYNKIFKFPEWCAYRDWAREEPKFLWDAPLKIKSLDKPKIKSVWEFKEKFTRESYEFECRHFCPGNAIDTVQDFLNHFGRFHTEELGLLHDDIVSDMRQPHLQTRSLAIYMDMETYVGMEDGAAEETNSENAVALISDKITNKYASMISATEDIIEKLSTPGQKRAFAESVVTSYSKLIAKELELKTSKDTIDQMLYCYKIGSAIRNRNLQKLLPREDQDQEIIELGDEAAHYAAPVADSSLYHPESGVDVGDVGEAAFHSLYEVDPLIVYQFRKSEKFISMLTWGGSMRMFKGKAYDKTKFSKLYASCLAPLIPIITSDSGASGQKAGDKLNKAFKKKDLLRALKILEAEYETAKEENRRYHRNRKH